MTSRTGSHFVSCRLIQRALVLFAAMLSYGREAAAQEKYFYIVNSATRMMAEVFAHRTSVGAPAVLWPHYGGTSQQFAAQLTTSPHQAWPAQGGWFLLRARHSGKCLRTAGYQAGAPIVQANCGGDAGQMWRIRKVAMTPADCPSGRCFASTRNVLENNYDRGARCLDAANGRFPAPPAQGAPLQAWTCIPGFSAPNAVNQTWELIDVRDWRAAGPAVK